MVATCIEAIGGRWTKTGIETFIRDDRTAENNRIEITRI